MSLLNFAKLCVLQVVNTLYQEITFLSPTLRLTGNCEDDEKYYKSRSILHIPFRENYENILRSNLNFNTWKEIFATSDFQTNKEYGLPDASNDAEEKIAFNENMRRDLFEITSNLQSHS